MSNLCSSKLFLVTDVYLCIFLSAVGSRTPNGEANQGGVNGSGDSGQTRVLPRNVTATAMPLRPTAVSVSGAVQPSSAVSQSDPGSLSTMIAEINSQIRDLVDDRQSETQASAGGSPYDALESQ